MERRGLLEGNLDVHTEKQTETLLTFVYDHVSIMLGILGEQISKIKSLGDDFLVFLQSYSISNN